MKDRTVTRLIGAYIARNELNKVRRILPIGKDVRSLVNEHCNTARKLMVACMGGTAQLRGLLPIINGEDIPMDLMRNAVNRAHSRVIKLIDTLEATA